MYSYMEWEGLKPKKWKDKGRKKFEQPALEIVTPRDSQLQNKPISKHFLPSINLQPAMSESICKQSHNNQESSRLDRFYSEPHFRKQFEPIDRQIYYEKKHLRQEKDAHLEDMIQGIKTYEVSINLCSLPTNKRKAVIQSKMKCRGKSECLILEMEQEHISLVINHIMFQSIVLISINTLME